jgi:hypothetical protein
LAGAPHLGKTTLLAGWCAAWRDGRPICGHQTNPPPKIGVLAGDRGWQSTQQWFAKAGYPDIAHYSLRDCQTTPWETFRSHWRQIPTYLATCLDQLDLPPGSLVIVDPLALWIAGNVNDYKACAIGLGQIDQIIRPRELTLIMVHHQGKQKGGAENRYIRPQDRILGSAALIGYSDTTIYMLGPEDLSTDRHPVDYWGLGWLPHNAPAETFYFDRDAQGLFIPHVGSREDLEEPVTPPRRIEAPQLDLHQAIVSAIPPEEGITTADLLRYAETVLQISRATLFRHLRDLEARGAIVRTDRGTIQRTRIDG